MTGPVILSQNYSREAQEALSAAYGDVTALLTDAPMSKALAAFEEIVVQGKDEPSDSVWLVHPDMERLLEMPLEEPAPEFTQCDWRIAMAVAPVIEQLQGNK